MAELLRGAPVAAALTQEVLQRSEALRASGITPRLAILRVGEREDDLSYERGALKRCEKCGIAVMTEVLPADVSPDVFFAKLEALNTNPDIHGILMFRPLPAHLDGERARKALAPEKDVDGCTDLSLAGVFTGSRLGFPPCTAESAMEILRYYGIDPCGKRAVVIGRSLVIGRPVAMLLMQRNATVTICHTRTKDVAALTREADIIIAASGVMESVDRSYLGENQVVIDVGISWNEKKGKLCGDVLFEDAEERAAAITPVPGGVGAVTTAILCRHVAEAAERAAAG